MDENKFWYSLWATIASLIAVVLITIIASSSYKATLVTAMVNDGADPIKAHCAVHGVSGGETGSAFLCVQALEVKNVRDR